MPWRCFSPWPVTLLLSHTHLSLKQCKQSLSTHILQIPKQTLSQVETYACALTSEVTFILIVCFTKTMSSYNLLKWRETTMHISLSNLIQPITIYLFTKLTTQVFCYYSCLHPFFFLFWISLWSVQQELPRKEVKILISAVSGLDLGTLWYGL